MVAIPIYQNYSVAQPQRLAPGCKFKIIGGFAAERLCRGAAMPRSGYAAERLRRKAATPHGPVAN